MNPKLLTLGLSAVIGMASIAGTPVLAAAPAAQTAEQTQRNKRLVSAAFDQWAAGGTDVFGPLLSPDVVWTIEGSSDTSGTYHGLADFNARAVQPFTRRLSSPVRPTRTQVFADGDHVIIHWTGEAIARDGRPYRNDYVWLFRMQDGKAMQVTAFLDLAPYEDVIRRIPLPE